MYSIIGLVVVDIYLAWVAAERYGLGFFATFFELLSGAVAFNWGQPPAQPDALFGYLLATLLLGLYALGWVKEIPGLRGTMLAIWWLLGLTGTFYYAS